MFKKNKGIIALFPAIIISGILLILCVGVSQSFLAFMYRLTLFERKDQSDMVAHTCVLRALAKHNLVGDYRGGDSIFIGGNLCTVGTFSTTTSQVRVMIGEAFSVENISL